MRALYLCVLLVLVALVGGCETGQADTPNDSSQDPPARRRAMPTAPSPSDRAAEPRGFTGVFSSVDALQRCKATAITVVCASTESTQRVRLDRDGASYLGETAIGYPAASPLSFDESVTTASGIECTSSERGIECVRGGHGFVLGDEVALILRGSSETRHDVSRAAPAPDPDYGPEADYVPPDYGAEPADLYGGGGCDSNYDGACIPEVPYDLDCPDVPESDFYSVGGDPHGFDGDGDGIACESY